MPKHFDMEIDQSFHSPSFVFVRFSINRSEEKDSVRERERERGNSVFLRMVKGC